MPRLGDVIGALLSEAVQARVLADLAAVRIADAYSRDELLRHLPVPRFRLPDITVDIPVLVSAVRGPNTQADARLMAGPTSTEIAKIVGDGLTGSGISLTPTNVGIVQKAVAVRAKALFEIAPQLTLSPAKASTDLAGSVVAAVRDVSKSAIARERLQALEATTAAALTALLSRKVVQSPSLEVLVTSGQIKAHGDDSSVVRVRLTIAEDAYDVTTRDDGESYFLSPE